MARSRNLLRVGPAFSAVALGLVLVVTVAAGVYLFRPPARAATSYNAAVLADNPVAFWGMTGSTSESDLTGHGHTGTYHGGAPSQATMLNADSSNVFNGTSQYLSVPSSTELSISTTHQLTWEGWIKPTTLQYASDYTDWMGKCANYSPSCEWEARMYSTTNSQNRCNRLSAYVFNPAAGLGSGADWQPNCGLLQAGQWYHVVGEYQTLSQPAGCNGPQTGGINIWVNGVLWDQSSHLQTGCMSQYGITPTAGSSPLNIGTMALDYWFPGAIGKVAVYNYLLSQSQISAHFNAMTGAAPSGSCASSCTIPQPTQTGSGGTTLGPVTSWHYTSNSNFDGSGHYTPGAAGFNLADISSAGELSQVPAGDEALVYVGLCNGADSNFINALTPFKNQPKVYGFYLMDEPDPTGQYKPVCTPANLKAESDWIHANIPGTKAMIIMMNFGSESNPTYAGEYTPANSGLDIIALDPYPCRTEINGCDYSMITKAVTAAVASGVPLSALAPVYQTFGGGAWQDDGGGSYLMPTSAQETQILTTWAQSLPSPPMDYAYSWGSQNGDTALAQSTALQSVFLTHNGAAASPSPTPSPKTGDINNDGQVNVFDLSALLSKWNTTNASSDLNHDGTVNVFDLSVLLSHWGT